ARAGRAGKKLPARPNPDVLEDVATRGDAGVDVRRTHAAVDLGQADVHRGAHRRADAVGRRTGRLVGAGHDPGDQLAAVGDDRLPGTVGEVDSQPSLRGPDDSVETGVHTSGHE
ncbi:MAG TPA: hypothetical protein VJM46_05520, partial [Candidatus Saccharimonadales bacterium]|nr:hypothetical protein [Candidatus Saccharimonadales bacterium]